MDATHPPDDDDIVIIALADVREAANGYESMDEVLEPVSDEERARILARWRTKQTGLTSA